MHYLFYILIVYTYSIDAILSKCSNAVELPQGNYVETILLRLKIHIPLNSSHASQLKDGLSICKRLDLPEISIDQWERFLCESNILRPIHELKYVCS